MLPHINSSSFLPSLLCSLFSVLFFVLFFVLFSLFFSFILKHNLTMWEKSRQTGKEDANSEIGGENAIFIENKCIQDESPSQEAIDAVYTWVNGSDEILIRQLMKIRSEQRRKEGITTSHALEAWSYEERCLTNLRSNSRKYTTFVEEVPLALVIGGIGGGEEGEQKGQKEKMVDLSHHFTPILSFSSTSPDFPLSLLPLMRKAKETEESAEGNGPSTKGNDEGTQGEDQQWKRKESSFQGTKDALKIVGTGDKAFFRSLSLVFTRGIDQCESRWDSSFLLTFE